MRTRVAIASALLTAGLLLSANAASAAPISACTLNAGTGFTCELYEEDINGDPSEIGWLVPLPLLSVGGYVVLLESIGNETDQSTWSDVVIFAPVGGANASTAQLLSDGCASGNEGDVSCFPSIATILGAPHSFILESPTSPVTTYVAGSNVYNIHSDPTNEATVPEPASVLLLGSGVVGLLTRARSRNRRT